MTKTRVALLSTLAEMHTEPIQYDLITLAAIVQQVAPDLLCVELPKPDWEQGDLSQAPVEVQRSLLPLAELSNVVVVPVAPGPRRFNDFAPQTGWGAELARRLDRALCWAQRRANSAEAIHAPLFEGICHTLCVLNEMSWDTEARQAWAAQNRAMLENILRAARRDPGRRMLVAVQCQRRHWLEPRLKRVPDVEVVEYREL
ncbi:MAG: hypothetical protein M5U01_38045 [Ardenticatenaceae bacterium]|nr:hypothetical protein [Ardenticatenaceae bacterium]